MDTTTTVKVVLSCEATAGTVFFATPQLETGEVPNRVNLLYNSDFMRTEINSDNPDHDRLFPVGWTKQNGITTSTSTGVLTTGHGMMDSLSGNALRIQCSGVKAEINPLYPYSLNEWMETRETADEDPYYCTIVLLSICDTRQN